MRTEPNNSSHVVVRVILTCALLSMGALILMYQPQGSVADRGDSLAIDPPVAPAATVASGYLLNGGMEGDYYWKYPNHYVAPSWLRWWIRNTWIPEYTYELPSPEHLIEGERAQRYHSWGAQYTAGLYQVVDVTPCVVYQLSMYARQDSKTGALAHTRLGLDPTGTQLTPNADVGDIIGLPAQTVWSAEQTQLSTWERLSVTAEAAGSRVTAILYAAPDPGVAPQPLFYSTYWDDGSLVQVPFPNNQLPDPTSPSPSGFIKNVSTTFSDGRLTIEWDTDTPASSQVLYDVTRAPITSTVELSHTMYFPLIAATRQYPLDLTPVLHHALSIPGIQVGDVVDFTALSRRPTGTACTTETSGALQVLVATPGTLVAAPSGSSDSSLDTRFAP
ncbi:MAG: hypothetical protein JXC32_18945 [Anaerolineae bacterium]|nr:hypothetical protein [Anaerolineae bacterium]